MLGVVKLNVLATNWPPTSVVTTKDPDIPFGTVSVQLNDPVVLVAKEPFVQLVIVTPPKTSPTVLDTEKPLPDTVTVAPTGPRHGL